MIDLHLHTSYSDGTDSVSELLENAEKSKLEIISITDHDSVSAYYELQNNPKTRNKFSGEIIVGSELKTSFENINIEILAYGIDYKLIDIKRENKEKIQNDILKHLISVAKDLSIKVDNNLEVNLNDPNKLFASCVFVDSILKYNENKDILNSLGQIDRLTFYRLHEGNVNSPFYYNTSIYYDDYISLIEKIHNAGGLAFLAHGLLYNVKDKKEFVERILKTTNIDGLECIHPGFNIDEQKYMIELCKKYNKYISGGSDYHAKNKPTTFIGTGINNNILVKKETIKDWYYKVNKI